MERFGYIPEGKTYVKQHKRQVTLHLGEKERVKPVVVDKSIFDPLEILAQF
jgi:hypothetical protein